VYFGGYVIRSRTLAVIVLQCVNGDIGILVINQLDAQNFCFTINLFHASACFEHHALIIRRSELYYTASGIITPIGDLFLFFSGLFVVNFFFSLPLSFI